jgi:ATP-dependent RNA helicase HelY
MFDAATTALIRQVPSLRGVNPETLPQELTSIYAELVALRMRDDQLEAQPERARATERLKRLATVYEAIVDTGSEGNARRASAFVAGTAHQILGRVMSGMYAADSPFLGPGAIHPLVAAPLLFMVAEQNADAREAARALFGRLSESLLETALLESIYDLASERLEQILQRAQRLQLRVPLDNFPEGTIENALYGMCWTGIVQLAARLLNRPMPEMAFRLLETPQAAFDEVVALSISEIPLPGIERHLTSIFSGPRHLARLLRHVSDSLDGAGIVYLAPPPGADAQFWNRWIQHRARTKPLLWRNHRAAIATEMLNPGRSTVLVLPPGAGKTTLSELKIAACLATGKKVIFLVPTLALVDQLRDDLAEMFPSTFADVEVSIDGDLTGLLKGVDLQSVEVMTPERCLALITHAPDALENVGLVVFDECHLLSPQGGKDRSLDAMLCLLQLLKHAPTTDLLLLSAMLTNANEFAAWIHEVTSRPCRAFVDLWKPSRQARGIVIYEHGRLNEIYTASLRKRAARLEGRSAPSPDTRAVPYALFGLHQNWNPDALADTALIKLSDHAVELAVSATTARPTPNANAVAGTLAVHAIHAGLKTIIFVQQAAHAPRTAKSIASTLPETGDLHAPEMDLWESIIAECGGAEFSLVNPRAAALPHNGDMIALERRLVEALFRRSDGPYAIVATPTLAQGMNLPAQLAILAGDKRHDSDGRAPLEAHEILNAAGRAGRAGHLANGVVLMIPEPVAGFFNTGRFDDNAVNKLAAVLPPDDHCVVMDDPVTILLDAIQANNVNHPRVRYFISRVRPVETTDAAIDEAIAVVRRSFAGFRARARNDQVVFEGKLAVLRAILAGDRPVNQDIAVIAASGGFPDAPFAAIEARVTASIDALPNSIPGWVDWLIDLFHADRATYEALLGDDVEIALYVMRGKKSGGPATDDEFLRLKAGFRAWLTGLPMRDVEASLGVDSDKIRRCLRARDLALKLASRSLYLVISSLAEVVRVIFARLRRPVQQPAILETLAYGLRRGIDHPDKIAFAQLRPTIRSRVLLHSAFARDFGAPTDLNGRDFQTIRADVSAKLAFSDLQDFGR